jgi:diaminopimelate decarboxylase
MHCAALARSFPTPFWVYDAAIIRARVSELTAAFAKQRVKLYYAVKANDHPAVIALAAAGGIGACLVSRGEFERAQAGGVPPGMMLMNGVGKSRAEIDHALAAGIGQLNAESLAELEMIAAAAEQLDVRARVGVRINPEITAGGHSHTTVARRTDKFGLLVEDLPAVRAIVAAHPALDWRGLSCHIGSQIHGVSELTASYRVMADLFRVERETQPQFDRLDLGGGFGVSYSGDHYAQPAEYAALIAEVTGDLQNEGATIQLEPGRFLVAEAGSLVTTVLRIKDSGGPPAADGAPSAGTRFVIVDAAMNDLIRPTLYDAYHPIALARASSAHYVPCTIAGPVCESADVFARGRELPDDTEAGDILIIGFAGAYGATMSSMYNARDRLAEIMVDGDKASLIRRSMSAAEFDRLTLSDDPSSGWQSPT